MPRRPAHRFVQHQGDQPAVDHPRPTLVAVRNLVLGHRLTVAGFEDHAETVRILGAAAEAAAVVRDLHPDRG